MRDILQNIMRQKTRSLLTGFGVFWGMFMMVVLLSVNKGVEQGFVGRSVSMSGNNIEIEPQPTTMNYKGMKRDRIWHLRNSDIDAVRRQFADKISYVSGINFEDYSNVAIGKRSGSYIIQGVTPEYLVSIPQRVIYGRYINTIDIQRKRKVCVIGEDVYKQLFDSNTDPCGQTITIRDIPYTIVGVAKCTNRQFAEDLNVSPVIQMPLTTCQSIFGRNNDIDLITVGMKDMYPMTEWDKPVISFIKERHKIHPADDEALKVYNTAQYQEEVAMATMGLTILCWLVGIGTLLAGLIGISNVMQVSVKERTKEIGIYRALGASPRVIIRQILTECLVLALTTGFLGMIAGLSAVSALRSSLAAGATDDDMLTNPYAPFLITIISFIILVGGAVAAGWRPVKQAMKIKAIDALRQE